MVFPVVMYGCESWTIKKAEHQRTDAFKLWCWRRFFFNLFLIEGYLLYSTVLVSTKHQHESAIGLPMSLPT